MEFYKFKTIFDTRKPQKPEVLTSCVWSLQLSDRQRSFLQSHQRPLGSPQDYGVEVSFNYSPGYKSTNWSVVNLSFFSSQCCHRKAKAQASLSRPVPSSTSSLLSIITSTASLPSPSTPSSSSSSFPSSSSKPTSSPSPSPSSTSSFSVPPSHLPFQTEMV